MDRSGTPLKWRGFARTRRNQDLACEIKVEAALIIDSVHIALRITQ